MPDLGCHLFLVALKLSPGPFFSYALILIYQVAGAYVAYSAIAVLINRTTIKLDEHSVSVRHAPLPWKGNRVLSLGDIRQLYCEEQETYPDRGAKTVYNLGAKYSYHLSAVLTNGRKVRLAEMPMEQAKYLEALLEEKLNVVDMAVPGEAI